MNKLRDALSEYVEMEINSNKVMASNYFFGLEDKPQNSKVLLDDINKKVLIRHKDNNVSIFTYDNYDQLSENGRRGARTGKLLRRGIDENSITD